MPALPAPGSAPTQQQIEKAKTAAALGYLASLPPATHLFQPTLEQAAGAPTFDGPGPAVTGATAARTTLSPGIDWASAFFASLGLPSDVVGKVNNLFAQYSDVNDASAAAISYIRGTPWYAQTFPGINTGIKNGLFSDESGYRDYVNKLNVLSHQYQGRSISADETTSYIQQGLAPAYVDKLFEAGSYVKANAPEIQYEGGAFGEGRLSPDQLTALGKQQVGLSNDLGAQLAVKAQKAAQRMQTIFQGKLATPGLTLGSNGLQAPGLLGTRGTPDVGA